MTWVMSSGPGSEADTIGTQPAQAHLSAQYADISSNNAGFDAVKYRRAGHVFIAIKATEGTFYVNPKHRSWCYAAGAQHIGIMHYHFARPDLGDGPEREAAYFLEVALPLAGGRDYLMLDLERAVPAGWNHDPAWSVAFDRHIQAHSRFHTILYATRSTLQDYPGEWLWGDDRRVVDADWGPDKDYAPAGYTVAARQVSGVTAGPLPHSLPGVGPCDVNLARGTFLRDVLRAAA